MTNERIKDIKQEDVIYSAGFFDGEGYFGLGYGGRIEIRIVNTQKEIIDYLHDLWGGTIYERKKGKGKRVYDLIIVKSSEVDNFLNLIYPFLRVKKEQVERVLKIKETISGFKGASY